ncbi:hypothetical protein [Nocardia sp. CA-120079]|uniref:hypothetical protein n=1 Tax=Nocardia sp. CA-120079 TaxID=3239974 RepID=UPI003D95F405
MPSVWTTYFAVTDADATAAKMRAGGEVIVPSPRLQNRGRRWHSRRVGEMPSPKA